MARIANYFFSFVVMWLFLALSAVFFMRDEMLEWSSWAYGETAPLMDSVALDLIIRPWVGVILVILAVAIMAKDFLQKSLSFRFKLNCALLVVGATTFVLLNRYALSPV